MWLAELQLRWKEAAVPITTKAARKPKSLPAETVLRTTRTVEQIEFMDIVPNPGRFRIDKVVEIHIGVFVGWQQYPHHVILI